MVIIMLLAKDIKICWWWKLNFDTDMQFKFLDLMILFLVIIINNEANVKLLNQNNQIQILNIQ